MKKTDDEKVIDEVVETTEVKEEVVADDATSIEPAKEEIVEVEETKEEDIKADEPVEDEPTKTDDAVETDEKKEEVVEEDKVEEVPPVVEEVVVEEDKPEDELEIIKRERDELKEERENAREDAEFRATIENNGRIFNDYCDRLTQATVEALANYGIDTTKTIDDLRKEDPTKAKIAEGIIEQAQTMRAQEEARYNEANAVKVKDIIFSRASKLLEKYELSEDQANVVAETFVNIMNEAGIKDLGEDLKAKVELAVARGRMLKPRIEAVANEVADIMQTVKEDIEDIKKETAMKEPEPVAPPVVDDSDFKEDATPVKSSVNVETVSVDNVLDKLAELPFKERTAFYKEHYDLIDKAARMHNRNNK